jgi:hypothetical protein
MTYKVTWDMTPNAMQNIDHIIRSNGVPNTIVEVGVFQGGSLQMWRSYFGSGCIRVCIWRRIKQSRRF